MIQKKWIVALAVLAVTGCSSCDDDNIVDPTRAEKSIVILYENDAHCAINGYTKFAGLRDAIVKADTSHVALVSSGDFLQGALPGAYSHGQYIVDIMKNVGYDAITLGNHEFDYGVPRMQEVLPKIGTTIVATNLFEYGGTTPLYQPYIIKRYGTKRIAFVGVTTPDAMDDEAYSFFDDNQQQIYDLRTSDVYTLVQTAVDKARGEGADYVVVLSHLGEKEGYTGVNSHGLVAATNGIDAVLDGHTHSVIPCDRVANKDGKQIPVSQTGTQFANVGKLWISPAGTFTTTLVAQDDIPYSNDRITATIDSINALLDEAVSREVGTVDFELPAKDASGEWLVRNEETALGDLVADAFRNKMSADIGLVNGGGVRNSIAAGTIKYGNVISVLPNDNKVVLIEATGAKIVAMLKKCTEACPEKDGAFPQVSGLKLTIHTASHTVSDVQVLNRTTGEYEAIAADGTYTIGINDYYKSGGYYRMLQDCRLIDAGKDTCCDVLTDYLETVLGGVVPDNYREPAGLITIVNN